MRARFIGGPAHGEIREFQHKMLTVKVALPPDFHKEFRDKEYEISMLKTANYDLDHCIIDGEEWDVFIFRG